MTTTQPNFQWTEALVREAVESMTKQYTYGKWEGFEKEFEAFKQSKEPSIVPERIEVKYISFQQEDNSGYFYYIVKTSGYINQKIPLMKAAIESALNDTVVEDESQKQTRESWEGIIDWLKGKGLEDYRWDFPISPYNRIINFLSEKFATLPLQQVQEDKPDSMRVGEDMICPVTKQHCDDECCPVGAVCNLCSNDIKESEPEAKDKPFVWTDELVKEYHTTSMKYYEQGHSFESAVKLFKQSKQSPTNLQFTRVSKPMEEKDVVCPPSTTVKDKQEWEIVSFTFRGMQGTPVVCDKGSDYYHTAIKNPDRHEINSVMSNGEVFSVSETVLWMDEKIVINGFVIDKGNNSVKSAMMFYNKKGNNCNIYFAKKLPTPNTDTNVTTKPVMYVSDDGKEMREGADEFIVDVESFSLCQLIVSKIENDEFRNNNKLFSTKAAATQFIIDNKPCLSLNDLLEVWDENAAFRYDKEYYKSARLYKSFEKKAKQKLNTNTP